MASASDSLSSTATSSSSSGLSSPKSSSSSSSSSSLLSDEFRREFSSVSDYITRARKRALLSKSSLRRSKLRSVYWKLFLGLLDKNNLSAWPADANKWRRNYERLLRCYRRSISNAEKAAKRRKKQEEEREGVADDPLSNGKEKEDESSRSMSPAGEEEISSKSTDIDLDSDDETDESEKDETSEDSEHIATVRRMRDLRHNNPLANDGPWKELFADNELVDMIKLDLSRTHPDNAFFQSVEIQSLMLNTLFVWAKLYPKTSYRQGMNELLAVIVLIVHRDCMPNKKDSDDTSDKNQQKNGKIRHSTTSTNQRAASKRLASSSSSSSSPPPYSPESILSTVLESAFLEHDAFALFRAVMSVMAPFFAVKSSAQHNSAKFKTNTMPALRSAGPFGSQTQTSAADELPIVKKCLYLHHTLLSAYDLLLYKHLNQMDVQPNLYALRWYRLLFAREFHIEDVACLWDAIFSDYNRQCENGSAVEGFALVDYICVSMLLYVRESLMNGDNSFCLRRLLKYPPCDADAMVEKAYHLHYPDTGEERGQPPTPSSLTLPSYLLDSQMAVNLSASASHQFAYPQPDFSSSKSSAIDDLSPAQSPGVDEQLSAHDDPLRMAAGRKRPNLLTDSVSKIQSFFNSKQKLNRSKTTSPAPPTPSAASASASPSAGPPSSTTSISTNSSGLSVASLSPSRFPPPPGREAAMSADNSSHTAVASLRAARSSHDSDTAVSPSSASEVRLRDQVSELQLLMTEMGNALQGVILQLSGESERCQSTSSAGGCSREVVDQCISSLQHIEAVLIGRLALSDTVGETSSRSPELYPPTSSSHAKIRSNSTTAPNTSDHQTTTTTSLHHHQPQYSNLHVNPPPSVKNILQAQTQPLSGQEGSGGSGRQHRASALTQSLLLSHHQPSRQSHQPPRHNNEHHARNSSNNTPNSPQATKKNILTAASTMEAAATANAANGGSGTSPAASINSTSSVFAAKQPFATTASPVASSILQSLLLSTAYSPAAGKLPSAAATLDLFTDTLPNDSHDSNSSDSASASTATTATATAAATATTAALAATGLSRDLDLDFDSSKKLAVHSRSSLFDSPEKAGAPIAKNLGELDPLRT